MTRTTAPIRRDLAETLTRIAEALESIASDLESLNRRDGAWRAS
jgi:hypothetical protein